jgi:hypothetical protein
MVLTAVLVITLATAGVGKASPDMPTIRLDPKGNTAETDQTFTVNITVTGITQQESLYGWSVKIVFDSHIINGVSAADGPFLGTSGYEVMWLTPEMNNTSGQMTMGALLRPTATGFPPNGATGDGVLASVTFKAVSTGTTSLHFGYTELYTVIGDGESKLEHLVEDGSFSNGGGLPLELVAALVVVVAVVVVAAVFLYRRRRGD